MICGHAFASMAAHRGVDKQVLSDVIGHPHVGCVTPSGHGGR
jgi:hypothetical protein